MKDHTLMTAIVAGGVGAVAGALFMMSRAQPGTTALNGVGAVIRFQAPLNGVTFNPITRQLTDRRNLRGWGGWGTPGFGRTGSAVYWRKVS